MREKQISALIDAIMNNQFNRVYRLLKKGINPNSCEDNLLRYSPLHYAAAHSGKEITHLLLEAGADLDAKDIDGDTPLQTAWLHHNIAFIQVFQQRQLNQAKTRK